MTFQYKKPESGEKIIQMKSASMTDSCKVYEKSVGLKWVIVKLVRVVLDAFIFQLVC